MGRKMGSTDCSPNGFMASLLRSMVELVEIVSDVSCRYSLGTNPRGVKDYTLATILIGLRLFSL